MIPRLLVLLAFVSCSWLQAGTDANRLTHLDGDDPFYPGLDFPKLTAPQWIGEPGVEAVVILAIDDMRETAKYETFLRPILKRLELIDGHAPVSIFCNQIDPQDAQLQTWLKEGLSLEVHTLTHPCPLLSNSNFAAAAANYHDCVDLLGHIPGNHPVAFRMPCCDSMNSPSPRFYSEMFNRVSAAGRFLTIDSSVMNLTTANDKSLPRELVLDPDGREKFGKYFPAGTNAITKLSLKSFATTIENYPYPYVIGKLCWEFPPMVPSDWEANNAHGPNETATVNDWEAALDATVLKQGVFTFIFHPHGWIRPEQLVEFIDHADKKYGRKVKFLNFREVQERLNKNLLLGQPLRAANGQDNGVRLLDLNNDGHLDVVIGNEQVRKTRVWNPKEGTWNDTDFPALLVTSDSEGERRETGARFGVVRPDGYASLLVRNESVADAWHFDGARWVEDSSLLAGLKVEGAPLFTSQQGRDGGVRFRDVDRDGHCELIVSNERQNAVFAWSDPDKAWKRLPFALPKGLSIVDEQGRDNGLRFVDINDDGYDDLLFSNEREFALHLFIATPKSWLGWERGWSFKVAGGRRSEVERDAPTLPDGSLGTASPAEIPMIVRGGVNRNNGVWFHQRQMFVQNEDTAGLPDKVERHSFADLLTIAEPPPKSPEGSLAAIRVRTGFKVELVASEPMVVDPVAFDWGPDGRFWVVEMRDYPLGVDGHGKAGGVIKYLEDTDGDGRYDKATVFLENVNFPNGIMVWRKGVLVSAAPEIFYAEDTDGDGKADVRKPILAGFNQGNQQHRVNGFEYGLDNWVYAANGGSGGTIRSAATGKTANLRGHDLRFNPDTGDFELVEGQTQFGRHRDDWGNWFGNENPTWLWHYLLPEHYLARNPELPVAGLKQVLANYPNPTRVFPISRPQQRFNWPEAANNLTSANSATPYRDRLFGPDFETSVFISEPAQNVVHREILETNGVTFTSHRAADGQDREFLASSDNWFRPTQLKTGPDGGLYVADIYRLVIEHPEYFPDELKTRPDLRGGDDKGRIYRVFPKGATLRPIPRLDQLDVTNLIQRLASTNGWERDMAQRMLVWRDEKPPRTELLRVGANDPNPKVRLQVLSTMEGLGMFTPDVAFDGLADRHGGVRAFVVQLSEPFLRNLGPLETNASGKINLRPTLQLENALLTLVNDPDLRVRYQLAFTLGEWRDARAGRALARIALKDHDDPHVQIAVLSSAVGHVREMLETVLAKSDEEPPPADLVASLLGMATSAKDRQSLMEGLDHLGSPHDGKYSEWQFAALGGFLDAIERRGTELDKLADTRELQAAIKKLDAIGHAARQTADDATAGETARLSAIRLLGRGLGPLEPDIGRLGDLLRPQTPGALQQAALERLKQINDARVGRLLLAAWGSSVPALRIELLNILISRSEWTRQLLDSIQSGSIVAAEISPAHQQQLMQRGDEANRERAKSLFARRHSDRQKLVDSYAAVNQLSGSPERGVALYRQNCMVCHRLKGEGNSIGPDLGTVADKPVGTLLVAILDPNQAFEPRYISYTAATTDDREITGIIVSETPNSITLRNAGGTDETILRRDIKELTSSRLSLMPEGFENVLKPQDMADLIAWIRSR